MDAYLSAGDIARINDHDYKIIEVKPNEIVIINPNNTASLITFDHVWNLWQVQNYYVNHQIEFHKRQTPIPTIIDFQLTGVDDADMHILLNSDYNTLYGICEHNLLPICGREWFWQQKVERDFGYFTMKYKNKEITYRQQYEKLINVIINLDMNAVEHPPDHTGAFMFFEIDEMLYLEHINILISDDKKKLLINALNEGDYGLADHLFSKNIWPDQSPIVGVFANGKIKVLDWLLSKNIDVYKYIKTHINTRRSENRPLHPESEAWLIKNKPTEEIYEY